MELLFIHKTGSESSSVKASLQGEILLFVRWRPHYSSKLCYKTDTLLSIKGSLFPGINWRSEMPLNFPTRGRNGVSSMYQSRKISNPLKKKKISTYRQDQSCCRISWCLALVHTRAVRSSLACSTHPPHLDPRPAHPLQRHSVVVVLVWGIQANK